MQFRGPHDLAPADLTDAVVILCYGDDDGWTVAGFVVDYAGTAIADVAKYAIAEAPAIRNRRIAFKRLQASDVKRARFDQPQAPPTITLEDLPAP